MTARCQKIKFFAVVEGRKRRVISFIKHERYSMKYGPAIVGEYPSFEAAMKATELPVRQRGD
jgi:hypothetical protein